MHQDILDNDLLNRSDQKGIKEVFIWWEKKRIIFNALVGLSGLYVTFVFCNKFTGFELFGIIMWGAVANIFYSTGSILEMADIYYFKGQINLYRYRTFLLVTGTLLYVVVTYLFGRLYYLFNG